MNINTFLLPLKFYLEYEVINRKLINNNKCMPNLNMTANFVRQQKFKDK